MLKTHILFLRAVCSESCMHGSGGGVWKSSTAARWASTLHWSSISYQLSVTSYKNCLWIKKNKRREAEETQP
jgi:hypothetical protein